jgi:thiamine transporter
VLGLGGIFRNRIENRGAALVCGSLVALGARYVAHILSGYILFSGYAEWYFTQEGFPAWGAQLVASLEPQVLGVVYSVVYNGMFMIPEIVLTAIVAAIIAHWLFVLYSLI